MDPDLITALIVVGIGCAVAFIAGWLTDRNIRGRK